LGKTAVCPASQKWVFQKATFLPGFWAKATWSGLAQKVTQKVSAQKVGSLPKKSNFLQQNFSTLE
jgi:hypothetical protein